MNGSDLAYRFYEEYGAPMLHEQFPEYEKLICVGLVGSGSECYGFDDEVSRDHDFEPGFCIFIPGEDMIDRKTEFELERAYSKLPKDFMGFKRSTMMNPVGGRRRGVIRMSDFFKEKLGKENGMLDTADWFSLPSSALAEFTNGRIYRDDLGEFTRVREAAMNMPEDIRLKKIAGNLILMAQAGQYNYKRCIEHGEPAAAQLAVYEFVKAAMECVFLLNHAYAPYYKWQFRALDRLPKLSIFGAYFEYLMTTPNDDKYSEEKYFTIEDLASQIIDELMEQKITEANCGDLEKHAYSVNDQIKDSEIRNLNIFYAV